MREPTLLANRFRIDEPIAEGGMARVYKGTDLLLGRTVAIKVLAAHLARDPQFVTRFQREAQSAASLSHANVVSVFDTGSDGEHHFIVMEYVKGRTLAEVIHSEAPLDPDRAREIAAAVCDALSVAHARGMVHRDVKPGNVMIDEAGVVKVMDFGIAKTAADGLTQAGAVLGTVSYLSPEQAGGEKVDARSDLFSLGCVLYEMLTGDPPVKGENIIEVAHQLMHFTPPRPSDQNPAVPEELDEIVLKALDPDPGRRFQKAGDMRRALLGDSSGRAEPILPTSRTVVAGAVPREDRTRVISSRPARSPQRTMLLVAGLLLVGGGLYSAFSGGRLGGGAQTTLPPEVLGPTPTQPAATTTTRPSSTTTAATTSTTEPSTTTTVNRRAQVSVAVNRLHDAAAAGVASGALSERGARAILDEVDRAFKQFEDGDIDDAQRDIQDARDEVAKYVKREELSGEVAAALTAALAQYGESLVG